MEFIIYTDGGCIGNKRDAGCPGAYAYVVMDSSGAEICKNSGKRVGVTNNQMELLGVIAGARRLIDYLKEYYNGSKKHNVTIFTDSKYVSENFNDYLKEWKSNKWKKSNRRPVLNVEYWRKLDYLPSEFNSFQIKWVKGHAKDPANNMVDGMVRKKLSKQGG